MQYISCFFSITGISLKEA